MTEDKKYLVYCHTNKVNGKKYVGMTCQRKLRNRTLYGHGYRGCRYFFYAIQKYGWDAFESVVLASDLTLYEAQSLERKYIAEFHTQEHKYGYNIDSGGRAPKDLSPEGRASLISSALGGNNPHARPVVAFDLDGRKLREFSCLRHAADYYGFKTIEWRHVAQQTGTCHGMIFRFKSDVGDVECLPPSQVFKPHEQRTVRGANSWHSTAVTLFDAATGVRIRDFDCIKHAQEFAGVNLSSVLRGKTKSANGYLCFHSSDVVGVDVLPAESLPKYDQHYKEVFQFDKNGNLLRRFPSLKEAAESTRTSYKSLSQCVRHKTQTAGGYVWRLSTDDSPFVAPKSSHETLRERGDPRRKAVDKIDLKTGDVIETFPSLSSAAESIGVQKQSIWVVVNHKGGCISCMGFGWRYHQG